MSRISHLPPRCPPNSIKDGLNDLIRYPSLDTILEEHPSWLEEVLTNSNSNPNSNKGTLRRSSSDSAAILECSILHCQEFGEGGEICSGLERDCVYGPNSPRQKSNLSVMEVNALMESMPQNNLQFAICDTIRQVDPKGDFEILAREFDQENVARRRSGQRSRVRKLQYIAELERTVEAYQTMGAELAAGVASLFQQRVALSLENKNLRKQIADLQKKKMIKSGQYQHLKNESEKLKMFYCRHRRSKSATSCFETNGLETDHSRTTNWQMLDFEKLGLD